MPPEKFCIHYEHRTNAQADGVAVTTTRLYLVPWREGWLSGRWATGTAVRVCDL